MQIEAEAWLEECVRIRVVGEARDGRGASEGGDPLWRRVAAATWPEEGGRGGEWEGLLGVRARWERGRPTLSRLVE